MTAGGNVAVPVWQRRKLQVAAVLVLAAGLTVAPWTIRNAVVFRAFIPDRRGDYRAQATRIVLVNGAICGGARSNIVHRGLA